MKAWNSPATSVSRTSKTRHTPFCSAAADWRSISVTLPTPGRLRSADLVDAAAAKVRTDLGFLEDAEDRCALHLSFRSESQASKPSRACGARRFAPPSAASAETPEAPAAPSSVAAAPRPERALCRSRTCPAVAFFEASSHMLSMSPTLCFLDASGLSALANKTSIFVCVRPSSLCRTTRFSQSGCSTRGTGLETPCRAAGMVMILRTTLARRSR
mmetsp:Transcript_14103/g.47044  ORF Transcript_14103/g.47044 Transcript_14103/m.47044 type:complete len:215 (+) Transcript_14103:2002-2646(+)